MDAIDIIDRVYASGSRPVTDISGLIQSLNRWFLQWPDYNFLHPCLIDGQPALVCRRDLSLIEPKVFTELKSIADRHGVYLKQDGRGKDNRSVGHNRRRNTCLVLTFCVIVLAASRPVKAGDLYMPSHLPAAMAGPAKMPNSGLQVISTAADDGSPVIKLRQARAPSAEQVLASYREHVQTGSPNEILRAKIADFLKSTYQARPGDPEFITGDLESIADYYARYPAISDLIDELREHKIVLNYQQDTWQAQAWGNQYAVDSVSIRFDTRLGAQLVNAPGCENNPACGISPADALLHELLHAKLMLVDNQHFLEKNGMGQNFYPFEHEYEVIEAENQLYSTMNEQDGLMRPMRHRHSGTLMQVSCPACAPGQQMTSAEF